MNAPLRVPAVAPTVNASKDDDADSVLGLHCTVVEEVHALVAHWRSAIVAVLVKSRAPKSRPDTVTLGAPLTAKFN